MQMTAWELCEGGRDARERWKGTEKGGRVRGTEKGSRKRKGNVMGVDTERRKEREMDGRERADGGREGRQGRDGGKVRERKQKRGD